MYLFKNTIKRLVSFLIPARRIIITTESSTKYLRCSALIQFLFIFVLSFTISFFAIRYNRYKNYHNYATILEENDKLKEEHLQLRAEFKKYEQKADKINEYLKVADVNIQKAEKKDYSQATNADLVGILQSKTALAYAKIEERKKYIAKSVKKLGIANISYNKLVKTAKVSPESVEDTSALVADMIDKTSVGGLDETVEDIKVVKNIPFLKISNNKINNNNYDVELDKLIAVEKTINSLPFGVPAKTKYRLTSTYGFRKDPLKKDGKLRVHRGIDMVIEDKNVVTPKGGVVVFAGTKQGYGNCIDIEHQQLGVKSKIITHYAHLDKMFVSKGQVVEDDEVIAIQGNTGYSTGPHLHYEIRINNQSVNPMNFIKTQMI